MSAGNDDHSDLDIGMGKTIKHCSKFKYLGVTLSSDGKSNENISNKIGQGRRIIRELNSLLWSDRISRRIKQMMYNCIFESVCPYGSETWELTRRNKDRLLALEMDYWRRSSRTSRLDYVRNVCIREQMQVNGTILDRIQAIAMVWPPPKNRRFENTQEVRDWIPVERRKRGRPARTWQDDVQEAMLKRLAT
ncbi:uncharacterized protein LOC115881517 [Sitophilus oryzae]|uniref:Uncharacterized protein LOC115881517 n=1 Tax=Sitophilus oryzae TaxID=7048 RepID=A0A6J2XVW0_SITOR|nr:uncharacterized protein LOC115881517 [Sitophilus oryzae]